jgi:hypothetical protein
MDYSELALGGLHPYNPAHRESTGLRGAAKVFRFCAEGISGHSTQAGLVRVELQQGSRISQESKEPLE